ncbi:MAG: PD-(D/E)XK nuclease family protein, partial [Oscillospiraceae bacterium]|nr:PD-(D/E)XK nuclease family protein [Oscillospiraceae bacterium]
RVYRAETGASDSEITDGNSDTDENTVRSAVPDENSVRMLEDMFAFEYGSDLTKKSAKVTVTEIAKSGDDDRIYLRRPDFAAEIGGLTAAEKGTAMHTFMQYADYSAAETDPSAEAEKLAENGLLSPEERDSLNIGQLEEFFRSELYLRMKKSDSIRREQKFLIKKCDAALDDTRLMEYNDNSMLQGIADCMFEENGEIVLIDYKTDKVKSECILLSRYDLQIKLYAAALGKIFGKRVGEAYLYSFSLGKAVKAI